MVGADRRLKVLVADALELLPIQKAGVPLEDDVPLLGCAREVVGRESDPISVARLLSAEELLVLVQLAERVHLAIIGGE